MSSTQQQFEQAAIKIKTLTEAPSDENLLELYSLYKQATVGDVNTERPGFWDFTGKAKWDAWKSKKGLTKEKAMTQYIDLVDSLI